MTEINIYTVDENDNHLYEFTTKSKKLNCREMQKLIVQNNNLLSNVKKSTNRMIYFNEPINNKLIFKNKNVVKLYASYK